MKLFTVISAIAFIITIGWIVYEAQIPSPALGVSRPTLGGKYRTWSSVTSSDASGGITVWSTSTDETFGLHSMFISVDTEMQVEVYDGSNLIATGSFGANGGACPILDLASNAPGNDLTVTTSKAGFISVTVTGDSMW